MVTSSSGCCGSTRANRAAEASKGGKPCSKTAAVTSVKDAEATKAVIVRCSRSVRWRSARSASSACARSIRGQLGHDPDLVLLSVGEPLSLRPCHAHRTDHTLLPAGQGQGRRRSQPRRPGVLKQRRVPRPYLGQRLQPDLASRLQDGAQRRGVIDRDRCVTSGDVFDQAGRMKNRRIPHRVSAQNGDVRKFGPRRGRALLREHSRHLIRCFCAGHGLHQRPEFGRRRRPRPVALTPVHWCRWIAHRSASASRNS
jgi:hypothetical protein